MTENEQIQEMARTICDLNTDKGCFCDGGYCNYNCLACEKAKTLYSKGYRKVERGEWDICHTEHLRVIYYKCSKCGYEEHDLRKGKTKFCPECGADMRGEKE